MRSYFTFIFLFMFGFSIAQNAFEGVIEMKMSTADKPEMGKTKMYFSGLGGRLETEMKLSPGMKPFKTVRIYKKENPDLYYVLNEVAATYSETDLSKYKATETPEKEATVKVVGTEKVQGFTCKHIIITSKSGDTEMWTTKELMDYNTYKKIQESDARSRNSSVAKALVDANAEGFPVKTLKKDSKGGTIVIELVSAEKKSIDKSLFEVPSAYTKTEIPTTGMEGAMQEIKQMGEETLKEE